MASQSFRPIYPLQIGGLALTPVFNAIHAVRGEDETRTEHCV